MYKNKQELVAKNQETSIQTLVKDLEEIQKNKIIKENKNLKNEFDRLIDRLTDTSFKLAIVGEFSSGKSTFLNALIGKDLLKHGRKETTATITEIYNDYNLKTDEIIIDSYYNDGHVNKNIPISNIMEVTATQSKTHSVVNEISKVTIHGKILDNDSNVCFVDTPGLNGIADKHREKTIEQIKNAHACIYLIQVRGLGESDIEFLQYICKYQHNIIFVQNFIDELKSLEGETPEQKIEAQKQIIEQKIIGDEKNIKYSIIGISARKALISRDSEFEKYNDEILTPELRNNLYKESRFDDVFVCINHLMSENERNKIQQKDTVEITLTLLNQLKILMQVKDKKLKDAWENSVEGTQISNYKKLLESMKQNYFIYKKNLNNYIESDINEIRITLKKEIRDELEIIQKNIKDIIEEKESIEKLEEYTSKQLSNHLHIEIAQINDELNNRLQIRLENLITNAISRIQQYVGSKVEDVNIGKIDIKVEMGDLQSFDKEKSQIQKLQQEIITKKNKDKKLQQDVEKILQDKEKVEHQIENNREKIRENTYEKNAKIQQLGSMPNVERKNRRVPTYENRGGLGILDAIFGPKEVIKYVPYNDNSAQRRWKEKKASIEAKYKKQENAYKAQERMLDTKKIEYEKSISHIQQTEEMRHSEIQSMQSLLETQTKYLQTKREKAKQEYLRETKQAIYENVLSYFTSQIYPTLEDSFSEAIIDNKKEVGQLIFSLFNTSYNEKIKALENMLSGSDEMASNQRITELINIIRKTEKDAEEFLCQA